MTDPAQFWASFTLDPRRPEYAPLRASDQDRNVVHQVLADAYADGRLDRDEFEARTADATAAKTLGELAALVDDLVPTSSVPAVRAGGRLMSEAELQERAVASWRERAPRGGLGLHLRVRHLLGDLVRSPARAFPWPVVRDARHRPQRRQGPVPASESIVDAERRKLERKQDREIEKRRRKGELGVRGFLTSAREHPSAVLLAAQLLAVLAYPFLEGSTGGRAFVGVVQIAIVLIALAAVRRTPTLTWVGGAARAPGHGVQRARGDQSRQRRDRARLGAVPRAVLLLRLLRDDPLPLPRRPGHPRRALRHRRRVHGRRLGLRLRVRRGAGRLARLVRRHRRRRRADLVRAALPVVHHADQRRPLRRDAGGRARPVAGDGRAGRRRVLRRARGRPPDRPGPPAGGRGAPPDEPGQRS